MIKRVRLSARIQKLESHWRSSELRGLRSFDLAVRVWLLEPNPRTLKKVEDELRGLRLWTAATVLSLRWLAFFDGRSDQVLLRKVSQTAPGPVGDIEGALLDELFLLRSQRRLHREEEGPSRSDRLGPDRSASPLERAIARLLEGPPSPESGWLLLDFETWEAVARPRGSRRIVRIVSPPMCLAFELFKARDCIELGHFAESVLDIRVYEGYRHDHRIFNLLSRMRKQFSPWLSVRTRQGRIYASARWERIRWVRPSPHESIRSSAAWREFLRSPRERATVPSLRARLPGPFRREDFEAAAGVSRSTANRMLAQLRELGVLLVQGAGKGTRYCFKAQTAPVR